MSQVELISVPAREYISCNSRCIIYKEQLLTFENFDSVHLIRYIGILCLIYKVHMDFSRTFVEAISLTCIITTALSLGRETRRLLCRVEEASKLIGLFVNEDGFCLVDRGRPDDNNDHDLCYHDNDDGVS